MVVIKIILEEMAVAAVHQSNITDYLTKKQQDSPKELGSEWAELEELHNKKSVTVVSQFF